MIRREGSQEGSGTERQGRSSQDESSSSNRRLFPTKTKPKPMLCPEIRSTVLQLKKVREPFDPDLQEAFEGFVHHVEEIDGSNIDLPEVSLLLSGAAKIYFSQVDTLVKDVQTLLDQCTRTKKAWIEKRKARTEESGSEENRRSARNKANSEPEPNADNDTSKSVEGGQESTIENSEGAGGQACPTETETSNNDSDMAAAGTDTAGPSEGEGVPDTGEGPETNNGASDAAPVETAVSNSNQNTADPEAPLNGDNATTDLSLPGTEEATSSQKRALECDENDQPVKKKHKNGLVVPPVLVSCNEEYESLKTAGYFGPGDNNEYPLPLLEKCVRVTKRKLYDEDNIPLKKAKEFVLLQDGHGSSLGEGGSGMEPELAKKVPEFSVSFALSQEFPMTTATSFPAEDQATIQECINDLHYLPFTFGLSKTDLSAAFNRTVNRISQIFTKNNVSVDKKEAETGADVAVISQNSKPVNGLHPVALNLGEIYNTFVKTCREECETYLNSMLPILEQSKEKSFAESRATFRNMITELQKKIVPKFAKVPLMAENTPEFFQHVTNFENKMKRILEAEAKKDEFDIRKYERDVLEVTAKESSELDHTTSNNNNNSDEFQFLSPPPASPVRCQSFDVDLMDNFVTSPSTRSSFDGSQFSLGGNSWVPLKHIFHHMKSFDRTETARSFYAVLALLSYQNLDINYEQLFSVESEKLISKQLRKVSREGEVDLDSSYPRGMRIMRSRCPDADKEEVFVAALSAESRDESFRHLLAQQARDLGFEGGESSNGNALTNIDQGIAEAMAEFVEESNTVFTGRLQARRRPKKVDS